MKKVLTTGCSFTHAPNSWANYLKETYDLINVAEGGAGNEMNLRNASLEVLTESYSHVIAQISGINRFEIVYDEKMESKNNYILPKEYYTWIKSTGDQRWWRGLEQNNFDLFRTSKHISDRLDSYIKFTHSDVQQILRTLMNIVFLQKLCKEKNINCLFFCWKNEFAIYEKQINDSAELTNWWNQIDWSKFWFHGAMGGLAEWGIANGYTGALHEDKINVPAKGWHDVDGQKIMIGHPSTDCHWNFAKKIIKPWIDA